MKPSQKIISELVHLADPEQEYIQCIGHIQPYGALLVTTGNDLTVVQVSQNTSDYLGIPAEDMLGRPLKQFLHPTTIRAIATTSSSTTSSPSAFLGQPFQLIRIKLTQEYASCQSSEASSYPLLLTTVYQQDDATILEIEPSPSSRCMNLDDVYRQLYRTSMAINQATSLIELYQAIVAEFRSLTGFDRVMLYRFNHDGSGIVEAEALTSGLEPYLGLHYPAIDIPPIARKLFTQRDIRLIPDIHYTPVPILSLSDEMSPTDLLKSSLRGVSGCHLQYLENMGVKATLTIPVVNESALWGLIACHHYSPRHVEYDIQRLCELLGKLVSVEVFLHQERKVKQNQARIRDLEKAFRRDLVVLSGGIQSLPIEFSERIEQLFRRNHAYLLDLIQADGVAIALSRNIIRAGQTPDLNQISELVGFLRSPINQEIFCTDCLAESYTPATQWATPLPGLLALSIVVSDTSYHILWFRTEQAYTVRWGGNPNDAISTDDEGFVRLSPRGSFQVWKEEVKGRSLPWEPTELQVAQELRYDLLVTALESSQASLVKAAIDANKANEAKSEFLANISHEIRTPMNAILGFAQLLQETHLDEDQKSYLSAILKGGENLLGIINDILDLSRMEAGELKLNCTEFNIVNLLADVMTLFRPQATEKGLSIDFTVSPDIPCSYTGPEQRLQQVLTNLIRNAIKFTHQGRIHISVMPLHNIRCIDDRCIDLKFSVEDTGIGLDEADQDRIFEAFTQVESSFTRQYEGTGLGLTICRRIVSLMGGDIGVTSALNQGSTFWFTACLQISESETSTDTESDTIEIFPHPSRRVLIVEDTPLNQKLLLKTLQKMGYEADAVNNGQEAIKQLVDRHYDVILMDCQMPLLDGYEATRQLRQREQSHHYHHTPIIGITAFAMTGDRQKCLDAGMDDYLSKPVRIHELEKLLEKWMPSQ